MTQIIVLRAETDAIRDAVRTLEVVQKRLAKRHGEQFRRLDREIEALEAGDLGEVGSHELEAGLFVFTAPSKITAILRQARELGVIE